MTAIQGLVPVGTLTIGCPITTIHNTYGAGIRVSHKGVFIVHAVCRHDGDLGPLVDYTAFNLLAKHIEAVVAVPVHGDGGVGQSRLSGSRCNFAVSLCQILSRGRRIKFIHPRPVQGRHAANAPIRGRQVHRLAVVQNVGFALQDGCRLGESNCRGLLLRRSIDTGQGSVGGNGGIGDRLIPGLDALDGDCQLLTGMALGNVLLRVIKSSDINDAPNAIGSNFRTWLIIRHCSPRNSAIGVHRASSGLSFNGTSARWYDKAPVQNVPHDRFLIQGNCSGRGDNTIGNLCKNAVQMISVTGREVICVCILGSTTLQILSFRIIGGNIMHIAVCGHQLLDSPRAAIAKVTLNIGNGICAGKNTNGIHRSTICCLAAICIFNGSVRHGVVNVICVRRCGISICKHNHNSDPVTVRINWICSKDLVCHIYAIFGISIALCIQAVNGRR